MRSTAGSLPTPAATPHQESLRSNTFWLGEAFTTFQGPVVTGQALLEIEGGEFLPVLALEDVFGNDVQADVVFVGEHVEKKRGAGTLNLSSVVLASITAAEFQHFLYVLAPFHLAAELVQRVEGIGDVLGGERLPVAPGDARAGLDRQLLEVGTVLVALRQPHDRLVGEGAVEGERLIDDVAAELRIGADDIWTPKIVPRCVYPRCRREPSPRVRLRGTSLISPAAIACVTASKPAGNDNAPARATLDSMKSRRVGARPQNMAFHPYSLLFAAPKLGPTWTKSENPSAYHVALAEAPPHDQQS